MKRLFALMLCVVTAQTSAMALELKFEAISTETPTEVTETVISPEQTGIHYNVVSVPESKLDAGRVRKTVKFRGNKSVRFAEFENLDLAPQQVYVKGLLNSAVAIDEAGVINYADLPEVNPMAEAVEKVETKVTAREHNNPAITGYGRDNGDVYGALRAKRAQDARGNAELMAKLDQFQVRQGRMQEKLNRTAMDNSVLVAAAFAR